MIPMSDYQPTIGLEVHSILKTRTKMFCDSVNDPEEREPNKNVCPVCLGHPGTLPTINKKAVEQVLRVGLALGSKINPVTKFDRKNYFYPDLPKGYQISQYDQPLVLGGELNGVRIRRVHLEEDAGRLIHESRSMNHESEESDSRFKTQDSSLVDFNRAGVPLMELVTEPDLCSAEQVVEFARDLQRILRYLGASEADMEKGQMRIEANVSLNMGPPVELKNINSFKAVGAAIAYEIERQKEVLERGEKVAHETRGWDEAKQTTFSQRTKEEAHDYRYFPEPDLPPFETKLFDIEGLRAGLPELPRVKQARFEKEFELSSSQAMLLVDDKHLADFFEAAVSELGADKPALRSLGEGGEKKPAHLLFNYLTSDLTGLLAEKGEMLKESKITPENLADLVIMIVEGGIMSRQAKDILRKMAETGEDPRAILRTENLETVKDEGEIAGVIQEVIRENSKAVEDYKKGKAASVQFLVGQAMKKLRGRGNPESLREAFKKFLG